MWPVMVWPIDSFYCKVPTLNIVPSLGNHFWTNLYIQDQEMH
jgi:hypothetical protein